MRLIIYLIIILLVIGGVYLFLTSRQLPNLPKPQETAEKLQEQTPGEEFEIRIVLAEQNNSQESGTATLIEKDGKTTVALDVLGVPSGIVQPAHIHNGTCENLGGIQSNLTPLENGKSDTVINTTLKDLKTQQPLAINLHKSLQELGTYVACGNLEFK